MQTVSKSTLWMFSGGMIYEASLLHLLSHYEKRSLDKGALSTGVYSSSCDILIVALVLTSRHAHG